MKIYDEIRRMKNWTRRWRAYMVLRHGVGLALDASIVQSGYAINNEKRVLRGILKSALEWNGYSIEDISLVEVSNKRWPDFTDKYTCISKEDLRAKIGEAAGDLIFLPPPNSPK